MGARRWVVTALVFVLAQAGGALAWTLPARAVVSQFGSQGEEAGQFEEVRSVAVDQASGDVYLLDSRNRRIDKFSGEGAFVLAWGWGVADGVTQGLQTCTTSCFAATGRGPAAGQFGGEPGGLAVDDDPLSASYEDVYVADDSNNRVEKFSPSGVFLGMFGGEVNEDGTNVCLASEKCQAGKEGHGNGEFEVMRGGIAVDSNGDVFVGDRDRVQKFSPEGAFIGAFAVAETYPRSLAVDSSGDFYVVSTEGASGRVLLEYASSGTFLRALDAEGAPLAVTVDPSGDLFVGNVRNILEYGPGGEQLASFDQEGPGDDGSRGIAFGETIDRIYVPGAEVVRLLSLPPPGPLVLAGSESATGVLPRTATLNATVNPEGKPTTYRFEYGTSTAYGTSIPVPDGEIPGSFNDTPVTAELSGLSIDTLYHYRIVATNSAGTSVGPDETFTTLPPASIDSESISNVASSSATVEGQINPLGADTTYQFEYGTSAAYGASAPEPEGDAGPGSSDVQVNFHLQGLEPATTYHYRLVARNVLGVTAGADRVFTTQPAVGGRATLPDARAWEMVSPLDKQGAALEPVGEQGSAMQASADGDGMTYIANGATEADPQGNRALEMTQLLSVRGTGGWVTRDIDTPNETVGGYLIGQGDEYLLFSSDLSLGLVEPRADTPLPPLPKGAEETVYLRDDRTGGYEALVTAGNVQPGVKFGSNQPAGLVEVVFASPDLSHVVVSSPAALTSDAREGGGRLLYEWAGGKLALASVLPNREPVSGALGQNGATVRHAVSDDGSRIVWSTSSNVYLRDMVAKETVQVDAANGVKEPAIDGAEFQTASSDGSRVFFTSTSRLTLDSTASATRNLADLYVFEVTSTHGEPLAGRLTDLTVDGHAGETADVRGVIGASEDGTSVFFAAAGLLGDATEHGPSGGADLYVESYNQAAKGWSAPKLVASLSGVDSPTWGEGLKSPLQVMTSRVSPDGGFLAFMSSLPLTGYDSRDARSGVADEEVFLYDSATGRVSCVSCDPTGARPVGTFDVYLQTLSPGAEAWGAHWLAGLIPSWNPIDVVHSLVQSRFLDDSGRLFFGTPQALVPGDTNGTWDVYEYEPVGVGDCSQGSPLLQVGLGGCVGLISSGGSSEESMFLDASESGDDVFFLTKAGLSPADGDGLFDVYDARVCSGSRPCLPVPPVAPPACSTSDSCKPAPTPQPEGLGAPASQTFSGAGNVSGAEPNKGVGARSLTRARKLSRALAVCRKKPKRKRTACQRQARRRYGSGARAKRSNVNEGLPVRAGR
jgi:hypothetical protein